MIRLPPVAAAVQLPSKNPKGRWYVWLCGAELSGTRFWGLPTTKVKPFATRLKDAFLVNPGLQAADQSALFCVVGTENGVATVAGLRIGTDGLVTELFRQGIGPGLPTMIHAGFDVTGGTLSLVWTIQKTDAIEIWRTDVTIANAQATTPAIVKKLPGVLYCVNVAPVAMDGSQGLGVLYKPRGEQHLVRLFIELHSPATAVETLFEPPSGPVTAWALASNNSLSPVVAFSTEYMLWCAGGNDKQWKVLAHIGEAPLVAGVFPVGEHEFWTEWVTAQRGLCFSRLRTQE